jgi:hypothetical protein
MECEGRRTWTGLLCDVGPSPSLSGLSRFLSDAPWSVEALVIRWQRHVREERQPVVETEREQQRQWQARRRGRRKEPLVSG